MISDHTGWYIDHFVDPTEKGVPGNILVLLCAQYQNGKYIAAQRELTIGCAVVGAGSKKVRPEFDPTLLFELTSFSHV